MTTPLKALVTGGNRGIGFEIAKGLVAAGLDVTIGVRDLESSKSAATEIGAKAVALDVTNHTAIAAIVNAAGPFDVLVNNAGVLFREPMIDRPDQFQESIDSMLVGPYHLIRACLPHMSANGYGRIVNLTSGWGSFAEGLGGPGAYGVAKAALNALTLSLSHQLPPLVKINAMCPGWVRTRMGGEGASLSPTEGADTALWLATLPDNGPSGKFFRKRKEIAW
jgi:NAD(P)-dependent dehydrogenase (short-subunit alcohol dehydrogenase family)